MEFINVNAIAFTLQGSGKQLNYLRLHMYKFGDTYFVQKARHVSFMIMCFIRNFEHITNQTSSSVSSPHIHGQCFEAIHFQSLQALTVFSHYGNSLYVYVSRNSAHLNQDQKAFVDYNSKIIYKPQRGRRLRRGCTLLKE